MRLLDEKVCWEKKDNSENPRAVIVGTVYDFVFSSMNPISGEVKSAACCPKNDRKQR